MNPARHRVAPLRAADLVIDALGSRVLQGRHDLRVSESEHVLLYTLAAGAGAAVTYRDLADAMGWAGTDVRHNALARHFSSLRRKLRANGHGRNYIEAVTNVGYRFGAMPAK